MAELDWHSYVPVVEASYNRGFFELPAFDIVCPAWVGASEIVRQFNFSASKNFALRRRPSKPSGANYVPCVRYRIGDAVTRYKLWDDANLVLPHVELYAGQSIKKNFCIEIWNLNGQANASQAEAIRLTTGIRTTITDFTVMPADEEDAIPAVLAHADLLTTNVMPVLPPLTNIACWYSVAFSAVDGGGGACIQLNDRSGNGRDLTQITGGLEPIIFPAVVAQFPSAGHQAEGVLRFDGVDDILSFAGAAFDLKHLFVVFRALAWQSGENILRHHGGGTNNIRLFQSGGSPQVSCECDGSIASNVPFEINAARIAEVRRYVGDSGRLRQLDEAANFGAEATAALPGANTSRTTLELGFANVDIAEVIGYSAQVAGADYLQLLGYLGKKYGQVFAQDQLSVPGGSPFLSNS